MAIVSALALPAAACAGGSSNGDGRALTVLAAASLTESFGEIAEVFERGHENVDVLLSFGPSDGNATQIIEGAPADVFASASPAWMDAVATDGPGVTGRADFVRNRLCVITPAGNPAGINTIEALAEPGVKLVLAAEDVPVGTYAREALANAGIAQEAEANVVSNEDDVKAVVQKVLLGEADAGIAYVTDLTTEVEGEVEVVRIPDDVNVIATYPIGIVGDTSEPELAEEFLDLVIGDGGQRILGEHGFLPPE